MARCIFRKMNLVDNEANRPREMTEGEIFERFKPIRAKIRFHNPANIIRRATSLLHERVDPVSPKEWTYLPWILLLLVRWTFQYGEVNANARALTDKDFDDLYRETYDLDSGIALSGQGDRDPIAAFMARTLFVQLPFQAQTYELRSIGRQLIIFEQLGTAYNVDGLFTAQYGLSIREFLRLYYTCWAGKADRYSIQYFHGIFPEQTIGAFFRAISVDVTSGQQFIRDYTQPGAHIAFQSHEHSPLELKPVLKTGHEWIPFSFRLFETALQNNIYDFLRRDVPAFSGQIFGPIFEQYVDRTISYYSDGNYQTETDLKKQLPKGSKVTDFLVEDEDAAIFIEAKGTELNSRARVYQSKESIIRNIRSTVLHAVIQCQETAFQMMKAGALEGKSLFALIVTYKEYLFGEGGHFWDDVIGDHVTAEIKKAGAEVTIPPNQIFYISVADFDWLLAGAKQRGETIARILAQVVERNQHAETRALMLRQHLESLWGTHYEPPSLEQARQAFQDEMMEIAKPLAELEASKEPVTARYPNSVLKNRLRSGVGVQALIVSGQANST